MVPDERKDRPAKHPRRRWIVGGSIAAVAILAASFLTVLAPFGSQDDQARPDEAHQTPEDILEAYLTALRDAAALDDHARPATAEAEAAVAEAEAAGHAAIAEATRQAAAHMEAAITANGLPGAPEGWMPGDPVGGSVGPIGTIPHPMPHLPGTAPGLALMPTGWNGLQATEEVPNRLASPATGTTEIDNALSELGNLQALLDEAMEAEELETLWSTLGTLPVPLPPLVPAAPETDRISDTVEPNEEQALLASGHAEGALGAATSTLTGVDGDLQALLAMHQNLVPVVLGILEETANVAAASEAEILRQAQQRIAGLQTTLEVTLDRLEALLAHYIGAVEAAQSEGEALIQEALDLQAEALRSTAADQASRLGDLATDLQARADARVAAIETETEAALYRLAQLQDASGQDMATHATAILDMARAAQADVQNEAAAQQAILLAAVQELGNAPTDALHAWSAQASGTLQDLQQDAAAAIGQATRGEGFAAARSQLRTELLRALETQVAADAVDQLHRLVEAHTTHVSTSALALTDAADGLTATSSSVLVRLQQDLEGYVGDDLGMILRVAEDYGAVPTPERNERAAHWTGVHGTLGGTLGDLDGRSDQTLALADQVLQAIQQARAELQAALDSTA